MKTQKQYSEARGYNLGIARELGLPAAVLYNQLLFWDSLSKGDWFFKSYDELVDELPISKRTVIRAREQLETAEYVETQVRKANGVPTLHWRIVRFATFHSANLATSDSANLATSINNKERNKESTITKTSEISTDVRKIYNLYLKRVVIPTRLKEKVDSFPLERLMEMAAARYKLSPKRREVIERRLKDAGGKMLAAAIIGYSREPWAMGKTERNWIFSLDEYLCRSYENVEKGAALYEQQQKGETSDPYANL